MKFKIRVRFTYFTFWGTMAELEQFAEQMLEESYRLMGLNDFNALLAIDKELVIANKEWIHQHRLAEARARSINKLS